MQPEELCTLYNHKLVNAKINASKQVKQWKYSHRYFLKHTQVCSLRTFNQKHPKPRKSPYAREGTRDKKGFLILYFLKQTHVRTLRNSTQQASKRVRNVQKEQRLTEIVTRWTESQRIAVCAYYAHTRGNLPVIRKQAAHLQSRQLT